MIPHTLSYCAQLGVKNGWFRMAVDGVPHLLVRHVKLMPYMEAYGHMLKTREKTARTTQGRTVPTAFETFLVLFTVIWCFFAIVTLCRTINPPPPSPLLLLFLSLYPNTNTHFSPSICMFREKLLCKMYLINVSIFIQLYMECMLGQ